MKNKRFVKLLMSYGASLRNAKMHAGMVKAERGRVSYDCRMGELYAVLRKIQSEITEEYNEASYINDMFKMAAIYISFVYAMHSDDMVAIIRSTPSLQKQSRTVGASALTMSESEEK